MNSSSSNILQIAWTSSRLQWLRRSQLSFLLVIKDKVFLMNCGSWTIGWDLLSGARKEGIQLTDGMNAIGWQQILGWFKHIWRGCRRKDKWAMQTHAQTVRVESNLTRTWGQQSPVPTCSHRLFSTSLFRHGLGSRCPKHTVHHRHIAHDQWQEISRALWKAWDGNSWTTLSSF